MLVQCGGTTEDEPLAEFVQKFLEFQLEDKLFAEVGRDVMCRDRLALINQFFLPALFSYLFPLKSCL